MPPMPSSPAGVVVGRYALYEEIAVGGMASVHIARLLGPAGFSRTVAIKRLHAAYARDPAFVAMFLDEARLAARIRHPNVVSILDVAATGGELFLVMEFVHGESLSRLLRAEAEGAEPVPPAVASSVLIGVLYGLHAAHEATGEGGEPLGVVHRDVSPHNIMVGVDGVARVLDFGIAKAVARLQTTAEGQVKGKLAYMSPEQLRQGHVDRRADVFSASIILWEVLTGRRLFSADDHAVIAANVLMAPIVPPSRLRPDVPPSVDEVVLRGLTREPADRYPTARDMLLALEHALPPASPATVGDWVKSRAGHALERQAARIGEIETSDTSAVRSATPGPPSGPFKVLEAVRHRASTQTAPLKQPADGAATQLTATDSSLATPVRRPRAERHALKLAPAVLAVLGLGAFGVWTMRARVASNAVPVSSQPAAPPTASAIATAMASIAPPLPPQTQSVDPAPSPTGPQPASSAHIPRAAPPEAPKRRRPSSDCDPPYVWDAARQIRVYKRQCQ